MLYEADTKNGTITLDKEAVAQLAADEIGKLHGRVWIANGKGAISELKNRFSGRNDADDVEVFWDGEGISIRVCVVIRFGVSIRTTTEQLIADIRRSIVSCAELPVKSVTIVVTGMLSKQIARRSIEIRG